MPINKWNHIVNPFGILKQVQLILITSECFSQGCLSFISTIQCYAKWIFVTNICQNSGQRKYAFAEKKPSIKFSLLTKANNNNKFKESKLLEPSSSPIPKNYSKGIKVIYEVFVRIYTAFSLFNLLYGIFSSFFGFISSCLDL